MYSTVKCKKCRNAVFGGEECRELFLDAHNYPLTPSTIEGCTSDEIFLSEDHLPQWILERLKEEKWSKGRINCQHCNCRIGAFNFIAGQKCDCAQSILPSVHLIRSKVDLKMSKDF